MYAVAEVTNEQYKESTGSRLVEVWESGLAKPPSVAIRSLHNVVNRYLRVTRPEAAEGISNGNVDIIVYLARHDNEEIFPQDIEQRFGVTRSTSCRVLGLMEQKGLIAREPVKRDARLKKIVLTDKSRHIAEVLHDNAKNMERNGVRNAETKAARHSHTGQIPARIQKSQSALPGIRSRGKRAGNPYSDCHGIAD